MGELFAVGASAPLRFSFRFRGMDRRRGYREEGWGITVLQGRAALTFKEPASRPDPATAQMLADGRALRGEGAVAYIRRWTHSASLANCHPFVRELGGREWAFAHNGSVPGLVSAAEFRPQRFGPVGTTDSEYAFCVLLDRLAGGQGPPPEAGREGQGRAEALLHVLHPASVSVARYGMFNYVLLTERSLVVFSSGEYGLYLMALPAQPAPLLLQDEDWQIELHADGAAGPCVLAASNPMTDGDWRRLDPGEMVVVVDGQAVARRSAAKVVGRRPGPAAKA